MLSIDRPPWHGKLIAGRRRRMVARKKQAEKTEIVKDKPFPIDTVIKILRATVEGWEAPFVTQCARQKPDPFKILVSTILSLRTRDLPTQQATDALFALAATPAEMMNLPVPAIAEAIAPVMYNFNKAQTIKDLSRRLVEEYGGQVPDDLDELLSFKGVGRKTANLVVTLAFGKPGICVDTHVHRISNRWGYCHTKTPEETEMCLREKLPAKYWIPINSWLVTFGQRVCQPLSPRCSECPLLPYCDQVGVGKHR
jgi:endonuclease-3